MGAAVYPSLFKQKPSIEPTSTTSLDNDATDVEVEKKKAMKKSSSPGARHGFHAHQDDLVSCVLYAITGPTKSSPSDTPIGFIDPRGGSPLDDYERHRSEFNDWQPRAPFHQPLYIFPRAWDIVCFPSWLIHFVPTHVSETNVTRAVFAMNLQTE